MIYFTKNFIVELEKISKNDDDIINNYKVKFNLNEQEIIVLDYLISQNKNKIEKEDSPNKSIEIEKGNNNLDNNEDEKEQPSTVEEQSDNNNNTILNTQLCNEEEFKIKEEKDKIRNDNPENLDNKNEIVSNEEKKSQISDDKGEKENDKYSLLVTEINNMKKKLKENEETNIALQKKIIAQEETFQKKFFAQEEKNLALKNEIFIHEGKIQALINTHKKIYFRDVSKYYILAFPKKYLKVDKPKAYDSSIKILQYNFSENKIEYLKNIINKMVYHYLDGNKFAHLEYFVSEEAKGIKSPKQIFKKIIRSYTEFMKFGLEEFKSLRKEFKDEDTIHAVLKKFISL